MLKAKFNVTGMTCSACSARVERAVAQLNGTSDVSVNLLTNSMQLLYDDSILSSNDIIGAVEAAGYGASEYGENGDNLKQGQKSLAVKEIDSLKSRLLWSLVFMLPLFYVASHTMLFNVFGLPVPAFVTVMFDGAGNALVSAFTQFLLVLPIMYLNRHFYIAGFKNLVSLAPNMDTLVGMGSMSAALFGVFAIFRMAFGFGHGDMALVAVYSKNLYIESAGMIVTLITVGKFLEARAKGKTSQALKRLMDLAPARATIVEGEQEKIVPVEVLKPGDIIAVRPGERIPADGKIIAGTTSIDEAAVSGESIPVAKGVGDKVISATLNKNGYFRFVAQKVGSESTISQIIKLVEEASASKAPIARMADKIAGVFVPAVLLIAVSAGLIWLYNGADIEFAFSIAISIMVISCPCALGLATPVAIMVGTGKGAENGILIKSGEALENAHDIDVVVMDKTGTLTEGKPQVTDVVSLKMAENDFIAAAAGIEQGSEHPLAEAITGYAASQNIIPLKMTKFTAVLGRGVKADCNNKLWLAGNEKFMLENGIDISYLKAEVAALASAGKTPLIFACDKKLAGIIAAADVEKATSKQAVNEFKKLGIRVIMLTGDNQRTAEAIQKRLAIPEVIAGVMPQDKAGHIAELQAAGHKVAMIGDGINDAPALAKADVGIAIGAGTDVAIESADAVLVKNDLLDAVNAIKLSRAVIRNIKENLFWAFFYNIICIPLAAGVCYNSWGIKLTPVMGAAAMSMSSICVCLNALRLRFFASEYSKAGNKKAAENIESTQRKEEKTMETTLKIKGMMCMHCQKHVTEALSKMAQVTAVEVNLEAGTAKVKASRSISRDEFSKVITEAGYELL